MTDKKTQIAEQVVQQADKAFNQNPIEGLQYAGMWILLLFGGVLALVILKKNVFARRGAVDYQNGMREKVLNLEKKVEILEKNRSGLYDKINTLTTQLHNVEKHILLKLKELEVVIQKK